MAMKKKQQNKKPKEEKNTFSFKQWLHSASSKCFFFVFAVFVLLLLLFFCVCTPVKYDLRVGAISHVTVEATKEVVDEVTTEEKRKEAADQVEPTYRFQQGVKEEVLASLQQTFNELRTIQQYGTTLRPKDAVPDTTRPFSEEEIDYALSLVSSLPLSRIQITTLLRADTDAYDEMVSTVTVVVQNSLNATIREGQVTQAISTIQQIVGYKLDVSLTQTILPTVLRYCIKPNMIIDQETTDEAIEKARDAVEPVVILQGQNIIREGDRITESQIEILRSLGLLNDNNYDYSIYGGALIEALLAMAVLLMMLRLLMKDILTDLRKLTVILLILLLCSGFAVVTNYLPNLYFLPIALGSILATVLLGYRAGLSLIIPLALIFCAMTSCRSSSTFYDVVLVFTNTVCGSVASVWFLKGRPQRVRVLVCGLIVGFISVINVIGIKFLTTAAETMDMLNTALWAFIGSFLSGILAVALQPAFEGIFHLATPSRLLELTNPNQPLMKRLMIEAPGTYHHSIIVANLAEAAADKIGANAYLARAGAYYHDIGKLKRPGYFSENQHGINPHEKTDPYVSAAILTAHTRDGYLLAQKEHLPPEVQDIILQHHGVTPVMFFYHKALQMANGNHVDINDFRYSGPKPKTKEASIVMLSDTIEAAVRSMKDPTPKAIDQFIERLIRGKLEDGQLSDCPLSLQDIDQICEAFSGILKGVYHERIEYPKVEKYAVAQGGKIETKQPEPAPAGEEEKTEKAEKEEKTEIHQKVSLFEEPVKVNKAEPAGEEAKPESRKKVSLFEEPAKKAAKAEPAGKETAASAEGSEPDQSAEEKK